MILVHNWHFSYLQVDKSMQEENKSQNTVLFFQQKKQANQTT